MGNIVAIAGRPNVGKSTLFNRLTGKRQAIVDDASGVTRDRQYGQAEWNGKIFTLIDTGGFVTHSEDVFEAAIREQVRIAMNEASLVLFMVDVTTGITQLDQEMADLLRKSDKTVFVVVNKVDNAQRAYEAGEFYSLGFEHYFNVSSINGSGTGELLDAVTDEVTEPPEQEKERIPHFAIIGQPNVGKSSLLNALLGEERNIVTDIAGTTRDTTHTHYKLFQKEFILIDTAGLRKKAKVHENLEFYSVIRAIKAIDEADVCLLLIDATAGITAQDLSILRLAQQKKKGILILVNKWDLIEKETNTTKAYEQVILEKTAPFTDIPVLFISALHKKRIHKAIALALEVAAKRRQKIPTSKLNQVMLKAIEKTPPPSQKGKYIRIKYVTQLPSATPAFAFFCNFPEQIKAPYKQYLENQIRGKFDFTGVPISIFFRKK